MQKSASDLPHLIFEQLNVAGN
uniref:Uncharacterized protein n=1 Tax=Arundo donax TaxID=35708 RepID=A0A0A9HNK8_ARUDO